MSNEIKLKKGQIELINEAISWAVIYCTSESKTAEFALLKVDIEKIIAQNKVIAEHNAEHSKMDCIFMYCDNSPKCIGKCKYFNPKTK